MMMVTLTTDKGSIIFDVMSEDADKVAAKIERMMTGFIVDRKEIA